jgi:carboxyl-terminal processing protease
MRRAWKFLALISVVVCVLAVAHFGMAAGHKANRQEAHRELELFVEGLAYVQAEYVDQVPVKDMMYGALTGLMASLDPHSQFLTPDDYEDLKADTSGHFGGIGVEIVLKDRLVTVVTAMEGTPAWDAGLKPHDRIVKIDETVLKDVMLPQAVKMLRGRPGTHVTVVVWREKESRLVTFKIKRAVIQIKDIKEARILEDGIGYLKLAEFSQETARHVDAALTDLKSKGMNALILDLRNNPGGLLDQAVAVTELFIPTGEVVVSVKGRDPSQDAVFKSSHRRPVTDIPVVVLINEGSASASEILAGCLKDLKRAILVGHNTFGKGSIQTIFPLKDGSALKVTTARYYTPSGASIHETGIAPDVFLAEETGLPKKGEAGDASRDKIFEEVVDKPSEVRGNISREDADDVGLSRAVDLIKGIKTYQRMLGEKDGTSAPIL